MIQTIALIIDAYRDLNARKLFWITLILSGLVMVGFAFLGATGTELTFAKWHIDMAPVPASLVYKGIFNTFVVGIWLSWAAVILALVSTAGLFPDLISGGTIDLYLSKPIGRLRLFLIKYVTGLLFVTLQVATFSIGAFLVFGLRAHQWVPALLLAIPIVVCVFSYLFGFCVFLGVFTRSTIAGLLLTILVWFFLWAVQGIDEFFFSRETMTHAQVQLLQKTVSDADAQLGRSSGSLMSLPSDALANYRKKTAAEELTPLEKTLHNWQIAHGISRVACAVIPKTSQTKDLLDQALLSDAEADVSFRVAVEQRAMQSRPFAPNSAVISVDDALRQGSEEVEKAIRHRSLWYVIGTSLLCEGLVLSLAAWIFCRRDY